MKKLKISLVMLITIGLLAFCASLPVIAAAIQDRATVNHSGFSDMQSVKLDFSERKETMPMMGKLALLDDMDTVNIDVSQASMTEEAVFASAGALMEEYVDAGIFQWFETTNRAAYPKLGIDRNDAGSYIVYWTVAFVNENSHESLVLDIDDETGKILCIRYAVYDSYDLDGVWKRNKILMDTFTRIYFAQLSLTEAAEYAQSIEAGYDYLEFDGEVSSAVYSFGDVIYGEVDVEFFVEGPGGFFVSFPQ